uniref:Uncharacterized protein n=1 Tax=viral metagenome TaxID=1070528 RepID=A0A6C0E9F2_9ZZZZ
MANLKINKINIVATLDFDCENKVCLCGRNLSAPTVNDNVKHIFDGTILIGECKHAFHKYCITNINKDADLPICFTCKTEWKVKTITSSKYGTDKKTVNVVKKIIRERENYNKKQKSSR